VDESVLLVPVPEAEALVGPWRHRHDDAARYGIPAHITVLYPFVPATALDDTVVATLRVLCGRIAPFDFTLREVRRFDQGVLYLAPEPADAFRRLTEAVVTRFPEYPPYGGAYGELTPHLTVAQGAPGPQLELAELELARALPLRARADEVHLMVGRNEGPGWRLRERFALGA
jgi:2'-5' RNA ligase